MKWPMSFTLSASARQHARLSKTLLPGESDSDRPLAVSSVKRRLSGDLIKPGTSVQGQERRAPSLLGEERGADCSPQETCLAPARTVRLRCPRCCRWTRLKVPNYGGVGGLGTGPCRAVGADPPCDTELGGDLPCRRLGSQGKYVERVYARDPCQAGR